MNENYWLTISEASERARCCRRTIYNAVRAGHLRPARVGSRLRFRPESVDAWLERCAPNEQQAEVAAPASRGRR